jgi:hypothetical protein
MMFCPNSWSQKTIDWTLYNMSQNTSFTLSCFYVHLVTTKIKFSNTENFTVEMGSLLWLNLTIWCLSIWNWFVGWVWKSMEKQARKSLKKL